MSLARDGNYNEVKTREDLCPGEFRRLVDGATEKPVTVWRRLMPHGNGAAVVSDNDFQLNIGTLRAEILSVKAWNVKILNAGYQQVNRITDFNDGIADLQLPLQYTEGLASLGSAIEWVVYPTLVFPLVVRFCANANNVDLNIGVSDEDIYTPTTIVQYSRIERELSCALPTQQADKVFYQIEGSRENADNANIDLEWGEHFVRRT